MLLKCYKVNYELQSSTSKNDLNTFLSNARSQPVRCITQLRKNLDDSRKRFI